MAAYPTTEQIQVMEAMQPSLRSAWNWLVSRQEISIQAAEAKASRDGILPPIVQRPVYKGLDPDLAKALKQNYIEACKQRRKQIFDLKIPVQWRPHLSGKGSEAERLGYKQDYQVINWHLRCAELPELPAKAAERLCEIFKTKSTGQKRKKFRRAWETMPLQVKSGPKLRVRKPQAQDKWCQARCNFEVFLPAIGWVAVYCDPGLVDQLMTPGNTVREGCTLRYEQGRWFASVKVIRRIPVLQTPQDGSVVGVDPGLAKLATTSDGDVLRNPRNLKYAEARELALSITDSMPDGEDRDYLKSCIFRQDARQRRRVLTQCRQFAAFLSKHYQFIGVEANQGIALGQGSRYVGATKTLLQCLLDKCGPERVREVESYHNSQDCSQCGYRDKKTWERRLGQQDQVCQCVHCGNKMDRDVNAARNVRSKMLESLKSQAV